jgi:hypothetical protein
MPNDAKLGLVVGVGLVIAVAVVFDRKNAPTANTAAIDKADPALREASTTAKKDSALANSTSGRRHTVQTGETLTSLARHYFGDESKAIIIRQQNPALQGAEEPAAGTVLVIPERDGNGP